MNLSTYLIIIAIIIIKIIQCTWAEQLQLCPNDLIVKLNSQNGSVLGHILESNNGSDFYAFQGIPYAQPPVGNLRFKIPREHPGWTGVLNATENSVVCVQQGSTSIPQSEDCLQINVYTPVKPDKRNNLPVYVWIHGGGYVIWDGAISRYGPHYLIDYGIIIVTLNYRLQALESLKSKERRPSTKKQQLLPGLYASTNIELHFKVKQEKGEIPANLGLRDQNLALQWVRDNIEAFGGDPQKVTIGGESAGSSSVSSHVVSKQSKGLFRAAILESGSAISTFSYVRNPGVYAVQLGQLLDESFDPENTTQLLEILQTASAQDIINNAATMKPAPSDTGVGIVDDLIWAPTVEIESQVEPFLSKPTHQALIEGDFAKVPLMAGFNSEEMLWFLPTSPDVTPFTIIWETFAEKSAYFDADPARIVNNKLNVDDADKPVLGEKMKKIYTNTSFIEDPNSFTMISSDTYIVHPTIRQADLTSNLVSTYLYQFSYVSTNATGAYHTEELLYLWKGDNDIEYTNSFQPVLRDRMCKLWTNFVKYLNPTPILDEDFGNVLWPMVDSNNISYFNLNETFGIRFNPRQYHEMRNILNDYLKPPFYVY